jgi:S-adenosylmethionine decarboxylase
LLDATVRPASTRTPQIAPMRLFTLDAWVEDAAVLVDEDGLRSTLHAAAAAGGATVVGDAFHVFPNGAVTGALLLAQSHLSIHTWPELLLANVDLLSCGNVDGDAVLRVVGERLGAARTRTGRHERELR